MRAYAAIGLGLGLVAYAVARWGVERRRRLEEERLLPFPVRRRARRWG